MISLSTEIDGACWRLLIFLSSPPGGIDEEEFNAWIPSPAALAGMETGYRRTMGIMDTTSFGALALLRLGRTDDAVELARLILEPGQKTVRKTTTLLCHTVLGQVAAGRGQTEEADSHFSRALEEASLSRLPMLELLAARDWKRYALEPQGRDSSEAEAVIDGACLKMKKTRTQLEPVLLV